MSKTIRVLLADDHPLVRAGLRATLTAAPDVRLVGEATDGHAVQRLGRALQPDVVLLDLQMPGPPAVDSVAALARACPAARVLVLSAYDDDVYVRSLVAAGIAGYVLKDKAPETVVQAIWAVMQGHAWFSQPILAKMASWATPTPAAAAAGQLTARERRLLRGLAHGWDNAHIAADLQLTRQTVRNSLSRLYGKLGLGSRGEAIVWAREHDPDILR